MSASLKRRRCDEDADDKGHGDLTPKDEDDACRDCGRASHDGICNPVCPSCDRLHRGKCTAFCRICTEIGHKWLHCPRYIPKKPSRRRRRRIQTAPNTYVGRVSINVPVVNEYPVPSPDALNEAILSQLKVALSDLQRQGVSLPARVTMQNVTINTNLVTRGIATATSPTATSVTVTPANDASLFGRVQRPLSTPTPLAPAFGPGLSERPSAHGVAYLPDFYRPAFGHHIPSQHIFGQPSFRSDSFSFVPTDPHQQAPTWPI